MKLYFSPLACSLASRVTVYEAGAEVTFVQIDTKAKKTAAGDDYLAIHALGLVPALELDEGGLLTENAAILEYLADRYPDARLAPRDAPGRTRLRQWLSFIGTELHKSIYSPLLDSKASEDVRAYALAKVPPRLAWIAARLEGRTFLLDDFSVADAYLYAVLNWSTVTPVDLAPWPAITAYHARLRGRPSVARAFAEDRALYLREKEQDKAREAARPAAPVAAT